MAIHLRIKEDSDVTTRSSRVNKTRTKPYADLLAEQLQKPTEAAAYLNAALADTDYRIFQMAERDVATARRKTRR